MKPSIYLDHAATTPLDPVVYAAMEPYLREVYANPSSIYHTARDAKQALEQARLKVAKLLGTKVTEIIWTSGGTESINLAIQGVLRAYPNAGWVTTAIEHDAVLSLISPMERDGHAATIIPVKPTGIIEVDAVLSAVTDQTVLVSAIMANNEIGTIQPVADIAAHIAQIRLDRAERGIALPLYLHTDACQAAGYLDLSVARLGVDLLSLNGSKIYGPKGSGLLYLKHGTNIEPLIYGGGQERGRRSGTENVAAAVGLATALELVQKDRSSESHRLSRLRDQLIAGLEREIPHMIVNGELKRRLPGNVNLTFDGAEGEAMVLYLDQAGIMASTGSACSSGDEEPSHVLMALGCTQAEATSSLRLTLGRTTTEADISAVIEILPNIVSRLRAIGRASL